MYQLGGYKTFKLKGLSDFRCLEGWWRAEADETENYIYAIALQGYLKTAGARQKGETYGSAHRP